MFSRYLYLSFILFTFNSHTLSAQPKAALDSANRLVEQHKYFSAFQLLRKADPNDTIPDFVLAKENLLLRYFAQSIMHRLFGLVDLSPDQKVEEIRGKNGSYTMVNMDIDSVLINLTQKYPGDYRLHKGLGDFYREVELHYGNNWFIPTEQLTNKAITHYEKALKLNPGAKEIYPLLGELYLQSGRLEKAATTLQKAVQSVPDNGDAHYNLAGAYIQLNLPAKALSEARKALEIYNDSSWIADTYYIIVLAHQALKHSDKALEAMHKAVDFMPGNIFYRLRYVEMTMELKIPAYKSETQKIIRQYPDDPRVYNSLAQIYGKANKTDELINILRHQAKDFKKSSEAFATINVFLAQLLLDQNPGEARKYLIEAKSTFQKLKPLNQQALDYIDSLLKHLEK